MRVRYDRPGVHIAGRQRALSETSIDITVSFQQRGTRFTVVLREENEDGINTDVMREPNTSDE
jgi:hypothetical protein